MQGYPSQNGWPHGNCNPKLTLLFLLLRCSSQRIQPYSIDLRFMRTFILSISSCIFVWPSWSRISQTEPLLLSVFNLLLMQIEAS
jgi:hypothetical protein